MKKKMITQADAKEKLDQTEIMFEKLNNYFKKKVTNEKHK